MLQGAPERPGGLGGCCHHHFPLPAGCRGPVGCQDWDGGAGSDPIKADSPLTLSLNHGHLELGENRQCLLELFWGRGELSPSSFTTVFPK